MDYLFFHSTYIIKELSFIIRCNLMWKYYGVKMKRKSMWKIFCNRGKNNNTYYQIVLSNFTRTSLLQTSQNEQLRLCYANGRRSILRLGWIFIVAYVKRSLLLSFSTLFFFHEYVFKILQKIKYDHKTSQIIKHFFINDFLQVYRVSKKLSEISSILHRMSPSYFNNSSPMYRLSW